MSKKKFFSLAIAGLITIPTIFSPLVPFASAAEYGSVLKDGINVRSGPSPKNEVLWEVFKGFPLQIVQKQGEWAQTVDFEGDKGWIFLKMLSDAKTVIVKAKTGNMRVGPGTNYEVAATVKYGVVFNVLEKKEDWIKVSHEGGTTGWVHNSLIWPN